MTVELPVIADTDRDVAEPSRERKRPVRALTDGRQSAIRECARCVFGVTQFRPLQLEAITADLERKDSLCVMSTGSGKSLCYQLPALLEGGVTLVVSPLIALMKDQLDALRARGIPADALNCDRHWRDNHNTLDLVKAGRLRLLYVAPERCDDPAFLSALALCDLRSIVIDEAHCISVWGPDFRPAYAKLGQLRILRPDVPLHAFTATATSRVREQIKESLMLRKPAEFIGDVDRPNLFLRVADCTGHNRDALLLDCLRGVSAFLRFCVSDSVDGIVYCPTRVETERIATLLKTAPIRDHEEAAFDAHAYHAGLDPNRRRAVHDWFRARSNSSILQPLNPSLDTGHSSLATSRIIVATVAFGLGIDKPDVRFVIHNGMPSSLDIYHQDIGRAGRDGKPAECILLYDPGDYARRVSLFQSRDRQGADDFGLIGKLDALSDRECYCGVTRRSRALPACRHAHLVEYFGQSCPHDPSRERKRPDNENREGRGAELGCAACDICLSEPEAQATGCSKAPARGRKEGTSNGE